MGMLHFMLPCYFEVFKWLPGFRGYSSFFHQIKEKPAEEAATKENAATLPLPAPRFRPIGLLWLADFGLRLPNGHSASGHCRVSSNSQIILILSIIW
jgi:hypothetical protein